MGSHEELVRELRQGYGLGASFFKAAAERNEMTDTDMRVIDLLESSGDATAGQLANLMGLTTGTFTAILNRLEKAGIVRRERDPNDGRRVIVRLATGSDSQLFGSLEKAWADMAAQYNDEQKALLVEFLQRSNALARDEITRLREAAVGNAEIFSAPLGNLERARLVFHSEGVRLSLRVAEIPGVLYQARFEGLVPEVKVKDEVVTFRYPKRMWLASTHTAAITLSTAIPWQIALKGGGAEVKAELDGLDLLEMEASGAGSMFRVELGEPSGAIPIHLGGSGSEFIVRRPRGVAARVHLKGWGSGIVFDSQPDTGMSTRQSANYEGAAQRYDIEMSGTGSMITVAAG